ncbi:BTAD domain-containing putative transcriptional regulator [Nocardioides sp. NPDC004968]|uniref:ATP-binding protein n=1 Tax=Nocardioides sp. NPDC004968 TaxID=3155894 RepID=UPI0033B10404
MGISTSRVAATAGTHLAQGAALRIQILGPLRLWRGDVELDAGPRQQAYLLALLLAHQGAPVSKAELIDLIWGEEAPDSAVNVIHKYIGALRRLLEPNLPAGGTSSYLVRRGDSYLFTAGEGVLDLATFRALVNSARSSLAGGRLEVALDQYEEALQLWQGSAGDGLIHGPRTTPLFAGLNDEFFDACGAAAELGLSVRRPERVLSPLQLAATMGPLHEPLQASLITVLGAAGRQADALSTFQSVRARLAEELGIGPGPALERAYLQVLRQDVPSAIERHPTHGTVEIESAGTEFENSLRLLREAGAGLIGRTGELAMLRASLEQASGGSTGLVIVEGEPGVGKTRLMEEAALEAADQGFLVAWGRCLDGEGAPPMWPWVEVIRTLLEAAPPAERATWTAGDLGRLLEPHEDVVTGQVLPGGSGQFRLFENVHALVAETSARRPVMVIVDDLQWADSASQQLFGHLASRLPSGTVLLGAARDRAPLPGPDLARTLAKASRSMSHRRFRLGPLSVHDVAKLVGREMGRTPDPDSALNIHTRTAGNPYFVQELARLLAGAGSLGGDGFARTSVPSTVLDVVRDRMAGLDGDACDLLEIAAVIGREVDLRLLARVAGVDVVTCLARLEPVEALGLLAPVQGNPYSVRFAHDLVRESVSEATSPRHATRLHLRVANALEATAALGVSVSDQVAYHLWAAGPLAEPRRTAAALVRSGRQAAAKSALEAAEQQLRLAAQVARTAGLAESELAALSELIAVIGMRSMYAGAELEVLERAENLARDMGREVEAAGFLYSRWATYAQCIDLNQTGVLAQQLLKLGKSSPHPIVRTYGLHAWGIHQWDIGNIGEAFRYLSQSEQTLLADATGSEENPVQHDLRLLMTGLLAETTALHGDVAGAHLLLDRLEAAGNDRYSVTIWATMAARIAAIAGDPVAAMRAADRGIAVDPDFSYVFLGTYQRLARSWAEALTGSDPAAAAAEAEQVIETNLLNPVRSCVTTWYTLLGDMQLAAGEIVKAAAALDRADHYLRSHGQRHSKGLLLLMRARLLQAQGRPTEAVRAAAIKAREESAKQQAYLFSQRAADFLVQLDHAQPGINGIASLTSHYPASNPP